MSARAGDTTRQPVPERTTGEPRTGAPSTGAPSTGERDLTEPRAEQPSGRALTARETEALRLAGEVPDPELPQISLADLGVLRGVRERADGQVDVQLTPTYTGCPAVETMATDIREALATVGHTRVHVETVLAPAWTTDDITAEGRRKLAEAGIAPPRSGGPAADGPVPLALAIRCPNCGSTDTELLSRFSSTACKALRRCTSCREPFDHFKELL